MYPFLPNFFVYIWPVDYNFLVLLLCSGKKSSLVLVWHCSSVSQKRTNSIHLSRWNETKKREPSLACPSVCHFRFHPGWHSGRTGRLFGVSLVHFYRRANVGNVLQQKKKIRRRDTFWSKCLRKIKENGTLEDDHPANAVKETKTISAEHFSVWIVDEKCSCWEGPSGAPFLMEDNKNEFLSWKNFPGKVEHQLGDKIWADIVTCWGGRKNYQVLMACCLLAICWCKLL